jgi:hypothetical protein
MSTRPKMRVVWTWVTLVILAAFIIKFTVYDTLRLAWFSHRIAGTDRIVATNWVNSVSMTITGDDTKKVVRAISSAGSGRPPLGTDWANVYDVNVAFYRGTTVLGKIEMDGGGLFLIHYHRPPFREGTRLLHDLVYKPLSEAARKKFENQ